MGRRRGDRTARAGAPTGPLEQLEVVDRRAWLALTAAAAAFALTQVSVTGTNIAFPAIEETFSDTPRSVLVWGLSGYSITLATFMVIAGRLADLTGRRRVFFAGVATFVTGTLVSAAAPAGWVWVAGRIVQALGGAMVVPSSLALVLPTFPAARRTSAVAAWAACGSLGSAMAPSVAAIVVDLTSWRVIYLLAIPVATAVVAVGWRVLQEPSRVAGGSLRGLDLLGVPMGTVAIGLVALAIVQGPRWGWTSPATLAALGTAAVLLPAFVIRSLRHPTPLLDVRIFRIRTVWSANLTNLFMSVVGLSMWFVWPLFLTGVWGYSLVQAGLAITPSPAASAVTALWAGRVADRRGARSVIGVGSLVPVAVMAWMALRFGAEPDYWGTFFPAAVMYGVGFGLTFAPLNGAALRGVGSGEFGQVNAAFNTIRNLGGGLGVAIMVAVLGDEQPIPLANFDRAYTVFAVIAVLPALVIGFAYPRARALVPAEEVDRPVTAARR